MDSPEPSTSILAVDDDQTVRELVAGALRVAGYDVSTGTNGVEALRAVRASRPDLVVLDVTMPEMDGFETCRRLRSDGYDMPIMFLTSHDDIDHKRTGFEQGADDYLIKPFSIEELVLRVQALLRRGGGSHGKPTRLTVGDVVVDDAAHKAWRGDRELDLTPTEFRLLRFLMDNEGRVMSREQIVRHVWEYDYAGNDAVVETYISYLRRKLDDTGGAFIQTVRGVGYVVRV